MAGADLRPQRILIVKLTSLGDVVHCLPAVGAIKREFPSSAMDWAVDRRVADIARACPHVDQVLSVGGNGGSGPPGWLDYWRAARVCRRGRYDLAIDMQGLLKSAVLTYASRAPQRLGFGWARPSGRWALNMHVLGPPQSPHAVDAYCELARWLGAKPDPGRFDLQVPAESERAAGDIVRRAFGDEAGLLVGVIAGSAWPSKRWPADRFAAVARALAVEGWRVVVLGTSADAAAAGAISDAAGEQGVSLAGRTSLGTTMAVLSRCGLVIGGDTGPVHIAAALAVPTLAIFGPTSPEKTGPRGPRVRLLSHSVPCQPCRLRECENWDCMLGLSAGAVLEAVHRLLEAKTGPQECATS